MAAREGREARIHELASAKPGDCLVVVSVAIPGADKNLPGAESLLALGVGELGAAADRSQPGWTGRGVDPLGPWAALHLPGAPERVKSLCVEVEERRPWGRLLDLDVYHRDGRGDLRQLGRTELGAPPRACLVCGEPARECILLRRHPEAALSRRTRELLAAASAGLRLRHLADALVRGARAELDLTPKPGLVDRHDNGSHPDLSYELMLRSIGLLPVYYRDLIELLERTGTTVARGSSVAATSDRPAIPGRALDDAAWRSCLVAGRAAEARMFEGVGANAHRGYIFLSGLVLLAAAEAGSTSPARLRPAIARLAARFFDRLPEPAQERIRERPGERLRRDGGVGGIEAEARAGLPAVFAAALPVLGRRGGAFRAMAALMCGLEDTTALHRGGRAGLERIRRDGARLGELLARGEDPVAHLAQWNDEYRATGLTMGGVADCLALAIALAEPLDDAGGV
jgi:holo-ACP synthase CitX